MKKQYINPVCKVMTLSIKHSVLDELFGNTSYIPVGNVEGDENQEGEVGQMFSNKSVWDE
jgi:hypothetical protein